MESCYCTQMFVYVRPTSRTSGSVHACKANAPILGHMMAEKHPTSGSNALVTVCLDFPKLNMVVI